MVLLIDNYDSFVHNLARYLEELGVATEVVRNDVLSVAEVLARTPAAIVLSPGPCTPREAGISLELVRRCTGRVPLLGVCLGHQAIVEALGGRVIRAPEPVHGRTAWIHHQPTPLFAGVANPFLATRYHSLVVDLQTMPESLTVTAWTADGIVMAVEHREHPVFGVQFHPESILTQFGHTLLANFLRQAGLPCGGSPPPEWKPAATPALSATPTLTPATWPGEIPRR